VQPLHQEIDELVAVPPPPQRPRHTQSEKAITVQPPYAGLGSFWVDYHIHALAVPADAAYFHPLLQLPGGWTICIAGSQSGYNPLLVDGGPDAIAGGVPENAVIPSGSTDFVIRFRRDLTNMQQTLEAWNVDGTGYVQNIQSITRVGTVVAGQSMYLNADWHNLPGLTLDLAFVRWCAGNIPLGSTPPNQALECATPLADWEFEGNGYDASGHGLNLTLAGSPSYVPTPTHPPACSAGSQQTFRAGQVATLDGTQSFPLDGGTVLNYSWSQISSEAVGIPMQDITLTTGASPSPTVSGLTPGPVDFSLTVTDGSGQSSSCQVHDGVVATDGNGIVAVSNSNFTTVYGQVTQLGVDPWPFFDPNEQAWADKLRAWQGVAPQEDRNWETAQAGPKGKGAHS